MNTMQKISLFILLSALVSVIVFAVIHVSDGIDLEVIQDCRMVYWNETEDILGTCHYDVNETICSDPPMNTSCETFWHRYNYSCIVDRRTIERSREECVDREFQLYVNRSGIIRQFELKYGDWGKCSYLPGNYTLLIVCDSRYDGNADGTCQSGESCMLFGITRDNIRTYMRNSGEEYRENDNTFFLQKLKMEARG